MLVVVDLCLVVDYLVDGNEYVFVLVGVVLEYGVEWLMVMFDVYVWMFCWNECVGNVGLFVVIE